MTTQDAAVRHVLSEVECAPATDPLVGPERLRNAYSWRPGIPTPRDLPPAQPYVPPHRRTTGV